MIRILFINPVSSFSGGAEHSLLDILKRLDRDRFDPVLMCPGEGDLAAAARSCGAVVIARPWPAQFLKTSRSRKARAAVRLLASLPGVLGVVDLIRREVRARRIDLVCTNGIKAHLLAIPGCLALCPLVWHFRDYPPTAAGRKLFGALGRRFARAIITPSDLVGDIFKNNPGRGRQVTVPNGVEPGAFSFVDPGLVERTRDDLGVARRGPVIGCIGALVRAKGFETVVRAMPLVLARFPEARLLIVGGKTYETDVESERERLAEVARDLGIEDRVVFAGFRIDVPVLLHAMDVLVQPSIEPEPFGRTVIEGMAAGTPVVASVPGGAEEIIKDGVTGRLVRAGDADELGRALVELLSDPGRTNDMADRALADVRARFDISRTVAAVSRLYEAATGLRAATGLPGAAGPRAAGGSGAARLALMTLDFKPGPGGVGEFGSRLARALARAGHETTVVTVKAAAPARAAVHDTAQPYRVVRVTGRRWAREMMFTAWLARSAALRRPDCVLCLHWFPFAPMALVFRKLFGLRYAVFVYGDDIVDARGSLRARFPGLKARAFRGADRVFAISRHTAALAERSGAGVAASAMTIVPGGVEPAEYAPFGKAWALAAGAPIALWTPGEPAAPHDIASQERRAARFYQVAERRRIILTACRLVPWKGVDTLLRALPRIRSSFPDACIVVCGDGPDRERIEAIALEPRLADHVFFAGHVADADMPRMMNLCEVFAMVSREPANASFVEGFGLAYLEAAACGKPVVGGRSGGAPEAVLPGVTGLLADPADAGDVGRALCRILEDPAMAGAMGRRGRDRVLAELTWDHAAARVTRALGLDPAASLPG